MASIQSSGHSRLKWSNNDLCIVTDFSAYRSKMDQSIKNTTSTRLTRHVHVSNTACSTWLGQQKQIDISIYTLFLPYFSIKLAHVHTPQRSHSSILQKIPSTGRKRWEGADPACGRFKASNLLLRSPEPKHPDTCRVKDQHASCGSAPPFAHFLWGYIPALSCLVTRTQRGRLATDALAPLRKALLLMDFKEKVTSASQLCTHFKSCTFILG